MLIFIARILLYNVPPLAIGFLTFQKLKKKYARPLNDGIDLRVWVMSIGVTAGAYAIYITLLALIAASVTTA